MNWATFIFEGAAADRTSDERMQFTLGMYGSGDFFTMKGVVEEFFEKIGMRDREKYDPNAGQTFLHRAARRISFTMEKLWDIWERCIRKWRIPTDRREGVHRSDRYAGGPALCDI